MMGRRRTADPPVLLPPKRSPEAPLPRVVPLLAALGAAVLFFCTLPAVREHQRLEADYERLLRKTQAAEAGVQRLCRELRDGPEQEYLRIKATKALMHSGAGYIPERDRRLGR